MKWQGNEGEPGCSQFFLMCLLGALGLILIVYSSSNWVRTAGLINVVSWVVYMALTPRSPKP